MLYDCSYGMESQLQEHPMRIRVKGEEWLDDLFAASEALSQLSYTPTRGKPKDDAFD